MMFDPGDSIGRLRACLFLGTWRALLCGEVHIRALEEAAAFLGRKDNLDINLQERDRRIVYAVSIAANRCFSAAAGSKMSCRQERLEAI